MVGRASARARGSIPYAKVSTDHPLCEGLRQALPRACRCLPRFGETSRRLCFESPIPFDDRQVICAKLNVRCGDPEMGAAHDQADPLDRNGGERIVARRDAGMTARFLVIIGEAGHCPFPRKQGGRGLPQRPSFRRRLWLGAHRAPSCSFSRSSAVGPLPFTFALARPRSCFDLKGSIDAPPGGKSR